MRGHGPLCAAALLALLAGVALADVKLQQVDRKINLNSQFARISEAVKAKNIGDGPLTELVFCQSLSGKAVLASYKVVDTATKKELPATPTAVEGAPLGSICHSVTLPSPLPAGEVASLTVTAVLAKAQVAHPAELTQQDTQLMLYKDNLYVLSPYAVSVQSTEVVLPSSAVKSYTEERPVSKSDKTIKYGKYDLIKPFTAKELAVHFENGKPFKHITSYVKEIEVSHWGNIYVEESYEILNGGARHAGSFSRLKYAHTYNGKANSFRDLKAVLPASARSLYYVDLIGNISSSNVRKTLTSTILDFDLRYPLMGGWKVDFTLGYSVPLEGFLFALPGGRRRLTMDLASPLEDVFVGDMTVRVVLPEGSSHITPVLPYSLDTSYDTKYTYLDTTGRPVVVLRRRNVVAPEHAAKLTVEYDFPPLSVLREPVLLVAVYFALFLAVIAYNRLEFTITRDDKWAAARDQEALATYMEQIQGLLEDEASVMARLSRATAAVREAADAEGAAKEKAAVDRRVRELEEQVKPLLAAVESRSPRVAAQVREVLDKGRSLQARYAKQLADRVDAVKKGVASMSELARKLSPGQEALNAAKRDLDASIATVFGAY